MHASRVNGATFAAAIVSVLLWQGAALAASETCSLPPELAATRPGAGGPPTEVGIGLYVLDVVEVDDVEQAFTADLHLAVEWRDPRLALEERGAPLSQCQLALDDVWHPYVDIINQRQMRRLLPETVSVDDLGTVLYRQRLFGELTAHLDLRDFPFDRQVLPIRVASLRYDDDVVVLRVAEERTGQLETLSLVGWTASLGAATRAYEVIAAQDRRIERLDFRLEAVRLRAFYITKAFLPLGLIVFMAWTVFWIDPSQLGPQIGVPTSAIITLIAFQFRLGQMLPKVSYLTRADQLILGSSLLVFLALGEAVLVSRLMHSGKGELALTIERWTRLVFALLFAALVAMTFR